jgi:non-lysosomal glucosylceramidase
MTTATASPPTRTYRDEATRAVAMPLGGIGTGTIALAGDGSLRQWQIHNQIDHLACVPQSFFAVWAKSGDEKPVVKVLQSPELYGIEPPVTPPNSSNDHVVPLCHQRLLQQLPGVGGVEFGGQYPVAELAYIDEDLPVEVTLEAMSPFVPLDARRSGIPAILFTFTLANPGDVPVDASIAASLQNAVGWDGTSPILDTRCERYGGNVNTREATGDRVSIVMERDGEPGLEPGWGSMALTAHAGGASPLTSWSATRSMWDDFAADGQFDGTPDSGPSARQRTWNGALAVPVAIAPGERVSVTFSIAWYFPNRYVDDEQSGLLGAPKEGHLHRIGNAYNRWYGHVRDVVTDLHENREYLTALTRQARDVFADSTLPQSLIDTVTSQMSIVRSPTCFWTEDGAFYGYEGCNGASAAHHALSWGGCCPLNCTHVWNYEMTLARLFPELAISMRNTEWNLQQHESGYLPHRVVLPVDRPRPWGNVQHGPDKPALDGLLGAILKTYREYRATGDRTWLESVWPSVTNALRHVWTEFDPEHRGVIEAEQPNTYDISIFGANTFIGTLYLAALRAVETMAGLFGDDDLVTDCRATFGRGRDELERRLWNGEYYIQDVDLDAYPEQNWATGCHSDHLLGQWWAHVLDLGHLLDPEHVRTAARSIEKHNFRTDFHGVELGERAFVSPDDQGLVLCTWPHGGRPKVPTRYSDEVWTGIEYEVAALLLFEGEVEPAMRIVDANRERHDGTRLNPWNDIECGDHYVRAMSSWSLLEAASGYAHDAGNGTLRFAPVLSSEAFRAPFFTATGWGTFSQHLDSDGAQFRLDVPHGRMDIRELRLAPDRDVTVVEVTVNGQTADVSWGIDGDELVVTPKEPWRLASGESLEVRAR